MPVDRNCTEVTAGHPILPLWSHLRHIEANGVEVRFEPPPKRSTSIDLKRLHTGPWNLVLKGAKSVRHRLLISLAPFELEPELLKRYLDWAEQSFQLLRA